MGGSIESCDSWFRNPVSQVSAHVGIGLAGEFHQYVQYDSRAWANGILEAGNRWPIVGTPPNHVTLSIETEDLGVAWRVTDAQYAGVHAAMEEMIGEFPSVRWLLRHTDISPRSRPVCPGPRWTETGLFAGLAAEFGLRTVA